MSDDSWAARFRSPLAGVLVAYIRMKRACGYRYREEERRLALLDRILLDRGSAELSLPREVIEAWTAKRPYESSSTHDGRLRLARAIAEFAARQGVAVHVPPRPPRRVLSSQFMPRIFTYEELARVFAAADALDAPRGSRMHSLIMPVALRVLYGCGLRLGELQRLQVGHVELDSGVLEILDTKFRKDRLVPVSEGLAKRLQAFAACAGHRSPQEPFFSGRRGEPYSQAAYYHTFREVLRRAGIGHGGRGQGPRLHDLRHTFAVHRLASWYRTGADLAAKLPVLSAYLGHKSIAGTQRYLRSTAELYPDISARLDAFVGAALRPER